MQQGYFDRRPSRNFGPGVVKGGPLLPPKPAFTASLQLCAQGVVLGKGTVIAALDEGASGRISLTLEGRDAHILALLSSAYQFLVEPQILGKLESVSRALTQGEACLAAIMLAQTDLPFLADEQAANALDLAAQRLARGENPRQLLKGISDARSNGLRPKALRKFNPYHAGNGQFTTADDATGAQVSQIGFTDAAREQQSPAEVRQKISDIAERQLKENPGLWRDSVARGDFGPGKNKCNLFVYETIAAAGADPGFTHRSATNLLTGGAFGRTYPPMAGDWADPSVDIPGWKVLEPEQSPEPGDVVAQRISYRGASGHVMIVGPGDTFIGTGDSSGAPGGTLEQIRSQPYLGEVYANGGVDEHGSLVYRRWIGK